MTSNSNFAQYPEISNTELLSMTTDIVAAHVTNNQVEVADLPKVIKQVYSALAEICGQRPALGDRPEPAVSVKKSITDDYIVCLEDGKKLKMLKRHLKTAYNMSPEQYRERWGLPADYPMVAPNYAKQRSGLAMKIGLGRKRKSQLDQAA
jgi:predicted transcriptional regulator